MVFSKRFKLFNILVKCCWHSNSTQIKHQKSILAVNVTHYRDSTFLLTVYFKQFNAVP